MISSNFLSSYRASRRAIQIMQITTKSLSFLFIIIEIKIWETHPPVNFSLIKLEYLICYSSYPVSPDKIARFNSPRKERKNS